MSDDIKLPDLSELEEFEHENPSVPMAPMKLSYEKCIIAQSLAFSGKSKRQISEETKIPVATIDRWLKNPEFIAYKNSLVMEAVERLKAENLSLLSKVVAARVAKIEDEGGDYSNLSNKDTASLIELMNGLTKDDKPEEETNYHRKLEELLKASQAKVIEINKGE